MQDSFSFYKKLLDTVTEHIVVIDLNGKIVYVNQSWIDFATQNNYKLKINWEEINYLHVCETSASLGDDYAKKAFIGISKVIEDKKKDFFLEYPCHGNNEHRWFMMNVNPFINETQKYIVISHQNITQRVLGEQKIKELSMLDSLTNLANRRSFNEFLSKEWNRNKRNKKPISLAMIDIDDFKLLNDTYGHQIGDFALKKIAKTFKKHIHRPSDLCSRYGGEEFAIIFGETNATDIYQILKDIQKDIEKIEIANIEKKDLTITVTIGLSTLYPHKFNNPKDLIKKSDLALYKGKREGKNRIVIDNS